MLADFKIRLLILCILLLLFIDINIFTWTFELPSLCKACFLGKVTFFLSAPVPSALGVETSICVTVKRRKQHIQLLREAAHSFLLPRP